MAIAAVLLFHAFFDLPPQTLPEYIVRKAFAPLWIGVNVFFVLSGFLISGILMDTKGAPNYFRSFYARRILRIFPLYFAFLALVFVLLPTLHWLPATPLNEQISYWTYTYNWSAAAGHQAFGLVHFWSLAVEEQFYLIWPILLFLVPFRRMPVLFFSLLGASFLFRAALFLFDQPSRYAYFLTPSRMEDLCFGAVAAFLVRDRRLVDRLRRAVPNMAWGCVALFVLAFALGRGFEANKWPVLLFGTTAVCGIAALAIIESTIDTRPRWWGARALRWLGTYSYGIYVFHQPIMTLANWRLIGATLPVYAASMAGAILISCLAGWVSFHAFEQHFLKVKMRFRARSVPS